MVCAIKVSPGTVGFRVARPQCSRSLGQAAVKAVLLDSLLVATTGAQFIAVTVLAECAVCALAPTIQHAA